MMNSTIQYTEWCHRGQLTVAQTRSSSVASIAIVVFGVTVGAISVVKETVMMPMKIAAATVVVVVVAKEMMMEVTVGTGRPLTNVRVRPPG